MKQANRRPVGYAIIGFLLGLLVLLALVAIIRTWAVADAIRESQKTNVSTIELIRDCTTPGGECYGRSEDRYRTAVSGINAGTLRIIAAALACEADGITERAELADCTTERAATAKP
jgi:hypothetical protein